MPSEIAPTFHFRMTRLLAVLTGLCLAVFLVLDHGWQEVLHALQTAGWTAVGTITLFHARVCVLRRFFLSQSSGRSMSRNSPFLCARRKPPNCTVMTPTPRITQPRCCKPG